MTISVEEALMSYMDRARALTYSEVVALAILSKGTSVDALDLKNRADISFDELFGLIKKGLISASWSIEDKDGFYLDMIMITAGHHKAEFAMGKNIEARLIMAAVRKLMPDVDKYAVVPPPEPQPDVVKEMYVDYYFWEEDYEGPDCKIAPDGPHICPLCHGKGKIHVP